MLVTLQVSGRQSPVHAVASQGWFKRDGFSHWVVNLDIKLCYNRMVYYKRMAD